MALSNKLGHMLLTTGNKSEMAVGYATLYGDMSGGYSVLKDVYKTDVFALARWRNQARPDGFLGPAGRVIPERVITKPPSAELRPGQTDQDTLPPYEDLDAILARPHRGRALGRRPRGRRLRPASGAQDMAHGGPRRVQAPPGAARGQDHPARLRARPALSHHQPLPRPGVTVELFLYNTLKRAKEEFVPLEDGHVRMYVCGPTVYDYAHIGNARPVVVFDVLYRLLKRLHPTVTYVRNITDVDDKINAAAKESGESIQSITQRTTAAFHGDMAALGALEPDHEPRATEHIGAMVAMIETLLAAGNAYEADGHVLFDVRSWPDYGKLSRHGRDELIAGARVEVAPYKRDPADFVLWKPSDASLPGWDSPWGRGRPGWHMECSAMSARPPRRDLRHTRRRPGPHLPPPRERDRAKHLRPRGP